MRDPEKEDEETVAKLFERGVIDALIKDGLITPSRLVSASTSSPRIEQDDLLPRGPLREMPPAMRKDAALNLLRLARAVDSRGYALQDGDLRGFFVDPMGRPKFHDLAAITTKGINRFPYGEFHSACLAPLRLISKRPELAELVIRAEVVNLDEDLAIRWPIWTGFVRALARFGAAGHSLAGLLRRFTIQSPYAGLLHSGLYLTFAREVLREWSHRRQKGTAGQANWTDALLSRLEKQVDCLDVSRVTQRWTNYYEGYDLPAIIRAGSDWREHYVNPRSEALIKALGDGAGRTLLDIGANQGYYALLAAHLGFSVTAIDYDIGASNGLYTMLAEARHPVPVRPMLVNFVNLGPDDFPRFEADAVLALGFAHHMRLVELLTWDEIAEKLANLTRRVLVTEFKPGTKASGPKGAIPPSLADDYTLDRCIAALEAQFRTVEVVGSYVAPGGSSSPRDMIVCRK